MTEPVRLQRKRTPGSNLTLESRAANGLPFVYVGRPTKWGNPFTIEGCREAGYRGTDMALADRCVHAFKVWLGPSWRTNWDGPESENCRAAILANLPELAGKNLACWCAPDQPCHADVLLEIANSPSRTGEER